MKLRTLFVCGWLFTMSTASVFAKTETKQAPEGPSIRVLLEKNASSAFLEAKGKFRVVQKDTNRTLSHGSAGKRFVVHALQDGLRWGEEYPDVYQIEIVPLTADTRLYVNGIQCKGSLSVYHVRDNKITIVNEVRVEDYLHSTLAIKHDHALSSEAMTALVIAARTDIYNKILANKRKSAPWDISADESGYCGYGVCFRENGIYKAVERSRFMVVESVKDSKPLKNLQMAPSKAEELAKMGYDAEKIIKKAFPYSKIGSTISADEVAIR
ncbi:MAG: hypothetical protein S4CHLAM123_13380 [Chlamydiales bacterium]|nr:hypothetical protein [Chlamydiales bacterium]